MILGNDSLRVVILGDWNKFYIQPEWVAENIFEQSKIEMGVEGKGVDYSIAYRSKNITIRPSVDKMIFMAGDIEKDTLNTLCQCLNNWILKATTPQLKAYGFNIDFNEDSAITFANLIDSMKDSVTIIENGYEIIHTKISRTLMKDGKTLNVDFELEDKNFKVHFNEHHNIDGETVCFREEDFEYFIFACSDLLKSLGYEMEEED